MTIDYSSTNIIIAVLTIATTLLVCAMAWHRRGHSAGTGLLELLRLALVALALFTLMKPEFVESFVPEGNSVVAVLYDVSDSMKTADVTREGALTSRASALQPLRDEATTWKGVADRMEVVIEPFSSELSSASSATDLNAALTKVTNRHQNVRAVVLASDGDWNIGEPPAKAARGLRLNHVPVFALGVGSEQPLPDLAIGSFDVPTFAVVGKPLRIPFMIESTLARDTDVNVQLTLPNGKTRNQTLRVPAMGNARDSFQWRPAKVGDEELTISIPVHSLELVTDNNELTVPINLRYESLKVLMIESYPRWEYRYTRNALERDPGVEVHCLMLHPDLDEVGGGRGYLDAFPSEEELYAYDVVFLGDVGVGPKQLSTQQCELIYRLVQSQAGGLVFMPGFRGHQASLEQTVLDELMPVDLDPKQPYGIATERPAQFALTEKGRQSLLTRLEAEDNDAIWRSLPGFYWYAAAFKARIGAHVLATHQSDSTRFGRVPLIATRTFGTGKVLFMGSDGAWRWRKGVEDLYHYRFWAQVVRWMAYQRTMSEGESMRLFFSPDRPQSGDVVTLQANVMNGDGEPLQDGTVMSQVIAPSGKTETIRLQRAGADTWGLFSGRLMPEEGGVYTVITTCRETGGELESEVAIHGIERERIGRPARFDVLKEIAQITRGETTSINNLQHIIQKITDLPDPEPIVRRFRLWSHPLWGGTILLLLGVFWTGRKYVGLI